MGSSLSFRLIYGYAAADDTKIVVDPNDDDEGNSDLEWHDILAIKRGATPPSFDNFPERNHYRYGTPEYVEEEARFRALYEKWKVSPEVAAWDKAVEAVKTDFSEIEFEYGGMLEYDYRVEVFGIKGTGFSSYDAVTNVGEGWVNVGVEWPGKHKWDVELERFIEALDIDIDNLDGPAWHAVISCG